MSLVFGTGAGNDIVVSEDKVIAQKRFANKLWQASKFVLTNLNKNFDPKKIGQPKYSKTDKWILKELAKTTKKVTQNIDNFRFHEAAQQIYQFFWHKFCDKTIEDVKIRINKFDSAASAAKIRVIENRKDAEAGKLTLLTVLDSSLKLLHPFMPFITEEIYQQLPIVSETLNISGGKPPVIKDKKKCLMIEEWPK